MLIVSVLNPDFPRNRNQNPLGAFPDDHSLPAFKDARD